MQASGINACPVKEPAEIYPYRVLLTEDQRAELRGLVGSGTTPALMLSRARFLLEADHGEVRPLVPAAPGCPARHDPEYVRGGAANLFLLTEPLRGWRAVRVSEQRSAPASTSPPASRILSTPTTRTPRQSC